MAICLRAFSATRPVSALCWKRPARTALRSRSSTPPPHAEAPALGAARASDLVLVPCRPGILDIRAIGATVDIAALAGKRPAVVLNAVPARGGIAADARAAILRAYPCDVAPCWFGHRAAFGHSLVQGMSATEYEPSGKAADEVRALWRWVLRRPEFKATKAKT